MDLDLFKQIYYENIEAFVEDVYNNNSQIKYRNGENYIDLVYEEYRVLNKRYKDNIFEKRDDVLLLDRHKVASCVCGAFLRCPVFDKTKMVNSLIKEKKVVESYFYYANQFVAFHAGARFLAIFLVAQNKTNQAIAGKAYNEFPIVPEVLSSKKGFWNSMLFNLAEIGNESNIGVEHYDMYAYAMIYYWLEYYFMETVK